ncbi:MAG: general secretion pathway protein GspD [Snowella sp.]|nr:MAG: general secretion pathway protein GspD [Snowella sp.]
MKNYHSLLLAKTAVCFLLIAQPSQAVNPSETDLTIASPLMTEDKVVDETKISIERDLGVDLGENLTTKDGDLLRSDSLGVKIKGLETPSLEVAPKIAQSYDPSGGMPVPPNGVMVPNPEIIIKSNGTSNPTIITPTMPMVPVLPRAVAPPVGDMSISNVNGRYDPIDLGPAGNTIIPRLVLRKAPADEVLKVLARYAGVNLVSIDSTGSEGADPAQAAAPVPTDSSSSGNANISLDIENEPVQNVFNSVLMASGLKASRQGNTIFVGKKLPDAARNTITRTIRLNQASAEEVSSYLALQGASFNIIISKPGAPPQVVAVQVDKKTVIDPVSPLVGLLVASDKRLNSVTLVGETRLVELATTLLAQLDARRRQVAVNVKVVDVNLNNIQDYNSSFSFGIGDGYFVQDNGAAVMRFGSTAPVSSNTMNSATGRLSNPPIITNPLSDANVFLDTSNPTIVQGINGGITSVFFPSVAGVSGNPTQTGLTTFTPAQSVTDNGVTTITAATAEYGLPSYFQYPKKFQAQVEAQIRSGNAKILTDPTLVVQEGEIADVKLTQSVVTSVNSQVDPLSGVRTTTPVLSDVGLSLNVNLDRIDDNGFITLSVNPTIAAPGATQQFESGPGANNTLTLINKREVKSGKIRLRDGQTLILTGVIQETDQTTTSKVPILGDIPILGALFRSQSDTTARTEVVIMVTPQILNDGTEAQFGFNYTPSKASADFLRQQGFPVQAQP